MPVPSQSPSVRPFATFRAIGVALGIAGLACSVVEDVSFGHVHLIDGHVIHHYHAYLGPHEHSEPRSSTGPDDDHDHHRHHHHPEAPHPHGHHAPQRTATVSAAPALFQPVACWTLATAGTLPAPVVLAPATPGTARPVGPPARPRGPPSFSRPAIS